MGPPDYPDHRWTFTPSPRPIVTLHNDGTLSFDERYSLDDAAAAFTAIIAEYWAWMGPARLRTGHFGGLPFGEIITMIDSALEYTISATDRGSDHAGWKSPELIALNKQMEEFIFMAKVEQLIEKVWQERLAHLRGGKARPSKLRMGSMELGLLRLYDDGKRTGPFSPGYGTAEPTPTLFNIPIEEDPAIEGYVMEVTPI